MGAATEHGKFSGAVCGVLAAVLFGASAPIAKRLLPETGSVVLASLLYLGAALALSIVLATRRATPQREPPLRRDDWHLLTVVTLT